MRLKHDYTRAQLLSYLGKSPEPVTVPDIVKGMGETGYAEVYWGLIH